MGCGIYTKYFIDDVNISNASIDIEALRLIPSFQLYNNNISGLWLPIIIQNSQSNAEYCDPLIQVKKDFSSSFKPCNCDNGQITEITNNYYGIYNETDFNCLYCCNPCTGILDPDPENPDDEQLTTSCDVQFHSDDFLAKVPVLNQSYISGFYDWKHLKQFPACNNPGLGIERFITHNDFCIDWKLKETISEIPYDATSSYHINEYTHKKSYEKSELLSSTCGNFILLSLPSGSDNYRTAYPSIFSGLLPNQQFGTPAIIPTVESFTKPYGFSESNFKNVFLSRQKRASYWKWQYTSGVMGWYRYFDIGRRNDQRPIPGVDFYISPGDVFFAKNDGPEPANPDFDFDEPPGPSHPSEGDLPQCPSGLKVVDGTTFLGIIPPSSNFIYISQNLYERFYNLYATYSEIGLGHTKAFSLSALMCTSPLYDGITTNLLDKEGRNLYTDFNDFEQIDLLNKNMLRGTKYDSANNLNYISNKEELVRTLYSKYGGYEWIPPRSSVTKNLTINNRSNSVYVDLDFDMVMDIRKVKFRNINSRPYRVCESSPMDDERINKKFYYDQSIQFGNLNIETSVDTTLRSSSICDIDNPDRTSYAIYGNILYNDVVLKSKPVFSGVTSFSNKYINNTLNRSYKAIAFNPHLDLLATHPNGGIYFNASSFGENETVVFNTNIRSARSSNIAITFTTKDVGIKLYKVYAAKLQSDTAGTESCLRFPADESKCRCYGLNINHYNSHPISCNTNRIQLSSSPFFVPGLSTRYSPRLKRYGGYMPAEAGLLFGSGALYNDLNFTPFLPIINRKLDPEYPYECEQSATIKLTNYSTTDYHVKLKNFSTRYSDIYISINEPADLLGPEWIYVATDGDDDIWIENTAWKRYLNKVTANNVTVYNQQEKILFSKGSSIPDPLAITLTNPFINAILGNSNERLSIPRLVIDDVTQQPIAFSDPCDPFKGYIPPETRTRTGRNRGDEISEVNITIKQKPRKQFLSYRIIHVPEVVDAQGFMIGQSSMGTFANKALYHPNFGIATAQADTGPGPEQLSASPQPSISNDGKIHYEFNLLNTPGKGEKIYAFTLDQGMLNTLEKISNFDMHRKPRLLFRQGSFFWQPFYSNRGGYRLNNIDYIGSPKLFNYNDPTITYQVDPYIVKEIQQNDPTSLFGYLTLISEINARINAPLLVPARPKTNLSLDYILHTQPGLEECENSDLPVGGVDGFPVNIANLWDQNIKWPDNNRFWNPIITSDPRVVRFYGSRPYFRIPEKRTIADYSTIVSLDDFIESTAQSSNLVSNSILKLKNGYYFYAGPDVTATTSYIFVGNDISILTKYSNLDIDYKNFSSTGYVYNSETECDTPVELYRVSPLSGPFLMSTDASGNRLLRVVGSNVIVGKKIIVQITDKEGKPIFGSSEENMYIKIYTEFKFRDKILDNNFDLVWPVEPNRSSVVIYDGRMISTDKDILLSNKKYMTKWGDLVKYDNAILNNPHLVSYKQIPKSIYDNLFLKQIVNDNLSSGIFKLDINRDDPNELSRENCTSLPVDLRYFSTDERPYFCIYHKYDLDHSRSWSVGLDQYQNYIPIMEINFSSQIPDVMTSGTLQSSALYRKNTFIDFPPGYIIPTLGTDDDFLVFADSYFANRTDANILPVSDEKEMLRRTSRLAQIKRLRPGFLQDYVQVPLAFIKIPKVFKSTINFSNPRADWVESLKVQTPRYALSRTILEDNQSSRDDVRQIFRPTNLNTIDNTSLINRNINSNGFTLGSVERSSPFIIRTIYADIDKPLDNTVGCGSEKCEITTAGNITLKANYTTFLSKYITYEQMGASLAIELTHDAGTVNLIGLNPRTSKKIIRTMMDPDNPVFFDNNCLTSTPKPKMPFYRLLNDIDAQEYLNNKYAEGNASVSPELDILDDNANEMLFRLLYGENQKINRKQLFKKNYILTQNELVNFVEPEITAKEIYSQILYNYDSAINPGSNINGTLNINGTRNIGDFISVNIYNASIQLSIVQVDGGNVVLVGNVGNNNINETIYRRTEIQNSLITVEYSTTTSSGPTAATSAGYRPGSDIVQDPNIEAPSIPSDPQPTSDNESITLIATRTTSDTLPGVYVDISIKEGACDPWREPFVRPPDCPEQGGSPAEGETPVEDPPGCQDPCPYPGGKGVIAGPLMQTDIRWWYPGTTYSSRPCGKSNWYDPFKYGYCRHIDTEAIKNDPDFKPKCVHCPIGSNSVDVDNYDGIEGGPEFDYEFQQCSTTFRLKGHLYRLKFSPHEERPSTSCVNYSGGLGIAGIGPGPVTTILGSIYGCWPTCTPGPKSVDSWHLSRIGDCWGTGEYFDPVKGELVPARPPAPFYLPIPTFGDPYKCTKVSTSTTTTTTRKVFKRTKTVDYGPYTPPTCPVPLINITYTKDKVIVNIPSINKTYCLPVNSNNSCPTINIDMPRKYTVTENITSECTSSCGNPPVIEIEEESNNFNFVYQDYTVVCELGRISYGDLQGDAIVVNGYREPDGASDVPPMKFPPCGRAAGWIASLCGGGPLWYNCGPFAEGNLTYGGWGAADNAAGWRQKMENLYNNAQLPCKVSPAIPTEDIIEGIIPGTCSLNFQDISIEQPKYRDVSYYEYATSSWTITTSIAYITYTYRKAKTIQDHLISGTNAGDINNGVVIEYYPNTYVPYVTTANGIGNCKELGFPPRLTVGGGESVLYNTFKLTSPIYRRTSCDSAPTCYYDTEEDDKQSPCNYGDWICWSTLSRSMSAIFLNRIFRDPTGSNIWN